MKISRKIIFLTILSISILSFLAYDIYAQQVLSPGSTLFTSVSIAFQGLQFSGNFNFLRIYWNSSYIQSTLSGQEAGTFSLIGVKCYVNCNPLADPTKCDGQPNNCTFVGAPGIGVCTIQPISYVYPLNTPDNATCIFYNPQLPSVEYLKADGTYPNSTFYPINFNLYLAPNFTVTVGKPISMLVIVQNLGVFTDNYTQDVTAYPSNLISLDPTTTNTTLGPLVGNSYGNSPQPFASVAKFTLLSTTSPINLIVNITSMDNNTISQQQLLQIRAGVSSLPDFGWTGIVQILVLASVVLFLMRKRL